MLSVNCYEIDIYRKWRAPEYLALINNLNYFRRET